MNVCWGSLFATLPILAREVRYQLVQGTKGRWRSLAVAIQLARRGGEQ